MSKVDEPHALQLFEDLVHERWAAVVAVAVVKAGAVAGLVCIPLKQQERK